METVIVICLLIIILLLLHDKFTSKKPTVKRENPANDANENDDMIGKPKPVERTLTPKATTGDSGKPKERELPDFGVETEEEEQATLPQEKEEPEEFPEVPPDALGSNDFSDGITIPQLQQVTVIMKNGVPDVAKRKEAVELVTKIQGTELYDMLENSIEGSSKRIAKLLDKALPHTEPTLSKQNDNSDFDINDFL